MPTSLAELLTVCAVVAVLSVGVYQQGAQSKRQVPTQYEQQVKKLHQILNEP